MSFRFGRHAIKSPHAARIRFTLPCSGAARVVVRSSGGRLVKVLADGMLTAGPHEAKWDGTNEDGCPVLAIEYFVELSFAGTVETQRIRWVR